MTTTTTTKTVVTAGLHRTSNSSAHLSVVHRVYCTERWPTVLGRQLYATLSLIGQFIVPLIVIAVLYYRIFEGLRARAAAAAAGSSSSEHLDHIVTHTHSLSLSLSRH